MGLLDRLGEITKALFTTDVRLEHLERTVNGIQQEVHVLTDDLQDVRERVARLEAQREADRAQAQAEVAQFKLEVERARLLLQRQLPPAPEQV